MTEQQQRQFQAMTRNPYAVHGNKSIDDVEFTNVRETLRHIVRMLLGYGVDPATIVSTIDREFIQFREIEPDGPARFP